MIRLLKQSICKCKLLRLFWIGLSLFILTASPTVRAADIKSICFKETCFQTEMARAQLEKQHGLMGRARLIEGTGMLFIYDKESRPVFWMKNMLIPLDFIWVDKENKIIDVSQNVPVCKKENCPTISISEPVRYVLEVPAGSVERSGIKIGDLATLKLGEIQ